MPKQIDQKDGENDEFSDYLESALYMIGPIDEVNRPVEEKAWGVP